MSRKGKSIETDGRSVIARAGVGMKSITRQAQRIFEGGYMCPKTGLWWWLCNCDFLNITVILKVGGLVIGELCLSKTIKWLHITSSAGRVQNRATDDGYRTPRPPAWRALSYGCCIVTESRGSLQLLQVTTRIPGVFSFPGQWHSIGPFLGSILDTLEGPEAFGGQFLEMRP